MRGSRIVVAGLGLVLGVAGCSSSGNHHMNENDMGQEIGLRDVPNDVRDAFASRHPNEQITDVYMMNAADGRTNYLVKYRADDGSTQRILYSPSGRELPR